MVNKSYQAMHSQELPIPDFFDPDKVQSVWRVPYQAHAAEARAWCDQHGIPPAAEDEARVGLLLVDVQNTFCIPDFELFVGGETGSGAVDDNRRLCAFLYRNLDRVTRIFPTLDTHQAAQIFHGFFLVNKEGEHPDPYTQISLKDIENGAWKINPALYASHSLDDSRAKAYLLHYTKTLQASGKYDLTVWPYHAMLGGIGHALVSAVEEAVFWHTMVRQSQPDLQIKGNNPLTENYSVLSPEVLTDVHQRPVAHKNNDLIQQLLSYDALIIAGQAKSHCVTWTIQDLLNEISATDPELAKRIYLLEDCTSPVVIPGVVSYTEEATAAFQRFANAGMHIVHTSDPVTAWPGFPT